MNILILTNHLPWPQVSGGHASQFATLKALEDDHKFRIVLNSYASFSEEHAKALEAAIPSVEVVRIQAKRTHRHHHLKPRTSERIKRKLRAINARLLRLFRLEEIRPPVREVADHVVRPYFPFMRLGEELISCLMDHSEWADILQVEFHENLFAGFLPIDLPKLYICHQTHSVYTKTFYQSLRPFPLGKLHLLEIISEADQLAALHMECAVMRTYQQVVVFSDNDKASLSLLNPSRINVSPFPLPATGAWISPDSSFVPPTRLVLLGPGDWHPNVDALEWFVNSVLPSLVNDLHPSSPILHVVGKWDGNQIDRYQSELVVFDGFAEDLSASLRGSISINPVQTGAGLRTKLLAAAMAGSPVVTTTHGAEGTGFVHNLHCLIADSQQSFAGSILALLRDSDLAKKLAIHAYQHVEATFSPSAVRTNRNSIYESMVNQGWS
jgi:glycosyltransferase involved in cell wall biosynthesis